MAKLSGAEFEPLERRSVAAIRGIIPIEAIAAGVPTPAVVVPEPCYVELEIGDPERWRALVELWNEVGRLKAEDALDPEAERWAAVVPEEHLDELRGALFSIESAEYDVVSAIDVGPGVGRLRFDPLAFPYGGTAPIEWLVPLFGGRVVAVDDGTGRREV